MLKTVFNPDLSGKKKKTILRGIFFLAIGIALVAWSPKPAMADGNIWESMASTPASVSYGGDLCYPGSGDYIYGFRGNGSTDFWRYSVSGNSWESMASTPGTVRWGGAICYPGSGDYIYAFRGSSLDFWRYSVSGNSWESMASTPGTVRWGGALCYPGSGDHIYAFKGGGGPCTDFWRYSLSGDSWESMASTPAGISYGGDLCYPGSGDYIYAFRGSSLDFYRYSLSGNSWESMTNAPVPVYSGSSLCYHGSGNYIYGFPATNNPWMPHYDFWRYSLSGDSWEFMADLPYVTYDGADLCPGSGNYIYAQMGNYTSHFLRYELPFIIGDFNSDEYVDGSDLLLFGDHWHFVSTDPGWDPIYDLVPDDIIDAADLQVFGDHWHEGTPPARSGQGSKGPNENVGITFDLNATTYGNQNDTIMTAPSVGDYIRVDVYAINVHNLDTYEFEVNYDPTELEYVTATATNPITFEDNILTSLGGEALGWMIDSSTPGVLSLAYTLAGTDTTEAPEGEGLVADIVFQVLSTNGDYLTFGDVHFYDSFGVMDIITDKGIATFQGVPVDDSGFEHTIFKETKLENYPNPFKSYTTIVYAIQGRKKTDDVEIRIYNVVGQLIDTIEARDGIAVWEFGDLPTGIYLYRITAGDFTDTKKCVILK